MILVLLFIEQPIYKGILVVIELGQLIPVMKTQPRYVVDFSALDKKCTCQNSRERVNVRKYLRSRNRGNPLDKILTQQRLRAVRDFPGNRVRKVGYISRIIERPRGTDCKCSPGAQHEFSNSVLTDTFHSTI